MNNALYQKKLEKQSKSKRVIIYKGKIIDLYIDTVEMHNSVKKFEIVSHFGAVAIIPVDKNGDLVFIKQWRRATDEILIEIPAGTIERHESTLDCAKRELQEEINYAAKSFTKIGSFYSTPGFCNEHIYLYVAEGLYKSSQKQDIDEGIDVIKLSEKEIERMIVDGKIKDSKTIAGFFQYKLWKNK